jgi:hypothetical protein
VRFLDETSKTGWLPQHWRRSLAAYASLVVVVAAANASLALRRASHGAAPALTWISDANGVTTSAVTVEVPQLPSRMRVAPNSRAAATER